MEVGLGSDVRIEQIIVSRSAAEMGADAARSRMIYRDAYFSQLVDRYRRSGTIITTLTRGARRDFIATGLE